VLDLQIAADQFQGAGVENNVAITASGRLAAQGAGLRRHAHRSRQGDVGVLYFADLVQKRIVNLDRARGYVTVGRAASSSSGSARVRNVFLDSLRINDLE